MKSSNKSVFFIVVAFIALLAALAVFGLQLGDTEIYGVRNMRYGIDINGGVEAIFSPVNLGRAPTLDELNSARAVMERRLDSNNILDRDIIIDRQNGQILVRFPWKSGDTAFDPVSAIKELGATAWLTFREGNQDPEGAIVIEGKHVVKATPAQNSQTRAWVVQLELNSEGAEYFAEATTRLVGGTITVYMDSKAVTWPTVESAITDGNAVITGMRNMEEARDLADTINAGALPFSMESNSYSTISPTLGREALNVMLMAGLISFILVCAFMIFFYRLPGFVACVALLLQVIGQLLAISIPQITLTLGGIAGIILSFAMGVGTNIIIAERIKEEIRGDKTVASAINSGFHKAFSAVFDGNMTTVLVAVVMMIFGSGAMLSFAYSLTAGLILNFLSGIFASRLMMQSLSLYEPLKKPFLYGARRAS